MNGYKTCTSCRKAFARTVLRCRNCGGALAPVSVMTPAEIEAKINAALDDPNAIDGRGARFYAASRHIYKGGF